MSEFSVVKDETKTHSPPFSQAFVHELLSTYGSPLYVYQGDRLRQTLEHITRSIDYPHTQFHFASVTNGNIALLQLIQQAGWGCTPTLRAMCFSDCKPDLCPIKLSTAAVTSAAPILSN